jgi:hypothetical protein
MRGLPSLIGFNPADRASTFPDLYVVAVDKGAGLFDGLIVAIASDDIRHTPQCDRPSHESSQLGWSESKEPSARRVCAKRNSGPAKAVSGVGAYAEATWPLRPATGGPTERRPVKTLGAGTREVTA